MRKKTSRVSLKEGKRVADKLQKTLLNYRKITGVGRGIAAPQIGSPKSVFVTFVGDQFQTYINPRLARSSRSNNYYRESCLSARELLCDVKRPISVTLSWIDEFGIKQTKSFDGFEARLIQHEYDHLQGVVCVDRAVPGTLTYCIGDVARERLRASAMA